MDWRRLFWIGVGSLAVVAGIAMLVFPGPGWLAIFVGISILAHEIPGLRQYEKRFFYFCKRHSPWLTNRLVRGKDWVLAKLSSRFRKKEI